MRLRAWVALTLAAATVGLGAAPALDGDEPLPVGGLTALPPPEASGHSMIDYGYLVLR
jgi:hypothetical protein